MLKLTIGAEYAEALRGKMLDELLRAVPRALALLNQNRLSDTYGSFDRKYWHYKILDFPCGMQQELVRLLAYVWSQPFEGNIYYRNARLGADLEGIFDWHARSIHADGSLDDYFPAERAYGATAYALAALTDALILTGMVNEDRLSALEKSGDFLASFVEQGTLSNHLAIAAFALENLHKISGKDIWRQASLRLLDKLSRAQHAEGWFPEYDGCDIGYQTVTVEFLARIYDLTGDAQIFQMLERCVGFLCNFVHPDGTIGGEYGSRNTFNFYPGGFAVLSPKMEKAAHILGGFFVGLRDGADNKLVDDGVFSHMLSTYITAVSTRDMRALDMPWDDDAAGVSVFAGAGFYRGRAGQFRIYGSLTKGGVVRVYCNGVLVHADTGLAGRVGGKIFFQNQANISTGHVNGNHILIEGRVRAFTDKKMTPFKMLALRGSGIVFGRWQGYSHLIRRFMQGILILNSKAFNVRFVRTLTLEESRVDIEDRLQFPEGHDDLTEIYRSTDCVNTHVITSDSFQPGNLLPWRKLDVHKGRPDKIYKVTIDGPR